MCFCRWLQSRYVGVFRLGLLFRPLRQSGRARGNVLALEPDAIGELRVAGPVDELFNARAAKGRRRPKRGLEGFEGVEPLTEGELKTLVTSTGAPWSWSSRLQSGSRLSLDFYPGFWLYQLRVRYAEVGKPIFAIRKDDDVRILREDNALFYALNEEVPIRLTDENVLFYLRIFFRFVRGRHGHFHLMERLDDVPGWHALDSAQRRSIEEHVVPARIRASSDGDGWTVDASFLFKDALFTSSVGVARDGTIEMGDEALRVDGIRWSDE